MKKQHFVGVVTLTLGLVISAIGTDLNNVATYADDPGVAWADGSPQRVTQQRINYPVSSCKGLQTWVWISGVGSQSACIAQTDSANGVRFGSYGDATRTSPIISFPGDVNFYQLTSFIGYQTSYSSVSDVLVAKYDQYPGAFLQLYSHVSHHLKKIVDGDTVTYTLDETPVTPLRQSVMKTWYMNGYTLSNNGRYVAVELMGDGIGVIDTQTMIVKRISNTGYSYGVGANPTVQLAITNDGSTLVAVGANAGFRAYHIDDNCGNYAIYDTPPVSQIPAQMECASSAVTRKMTQLMPAGAITETMPTFSDDGQFLSLYASDHLGNNFVVLAASGGSTSSIPYLALGDSFTSGEGEVDDSYYELGTDTAKEKCHVSTRSYPFLLAQAAALVKPDVESVACSGATMADVLGDDAAYWGQSKRLGSGGENLSENEKEAAQDEALAEFIPGRIHQASFVKEYRPAEMTIGIGGNDAGLFSKLQACAMPDTCEWASDAGRPEVAKEIEGLFPKLVDAYMKLKQLSPTTQMYVVDYPEPIDPIGQCDMLTGLLLNQDERQLMSESVDYLDRVIAAAADKAGMTFLDVENSFGDEKLCGQDGQTAMNGIRTGNDSAPIALLQKFVKLGNETFHPTPYGHDLIASAIEANHGSITSGGCTYGSCPGNPDTAVPQPIDAYWSGSMPPELSPTAIHGSFLASTDVLDSQKPLTIKVTENDFAPNSQVHVTIHSDKIAAGTIQTDENGKITTQITVPTGLVPGYHTVHLEGESASGEAIDMYEVFLYEPPEDESAGGQITLVNEDRSTTDSDDESSRPSLTPPLLSLPLTPSLATASVKLASAQTEASSVWSGSGGSIIPGSVRPAAVTILPAAIKDAAVKGASIVRRYGKRPVWWLIALGTFILIGVTIILRRKRDRRRH